MKVKRSDLLSTLIPLRIAAKQSPHNNQVVCQRGKLQYLARGAFLEVENDLTHQFPEFAFDISFLEKLVCIPHQDELTLEFDKHRWIFVSDSSTLVKEVVRKVPRDYEMVDEVVLLPLLSGKSSIELDSSSWYGALSRMPTVHNPARSHIPLVTVEVSDGNLSFSTEDGGISLQTTIPLSKPDKAMPLKGTFALGPMCWDFRFFDPVDHEYAIKISYGDMFSTLLMEHENGVRVVSAQTYL